MPIGSVAARTRPKSDLWTSVCEYSNHVSSETFLAHNANPQPHAMCNDMNAIRPADSAPGVRPRMQARQVPPPTQDDDHLRRTSSDPVTAAGTSHPTSPAPPAPQPEGSDSQAPSQMMTELVKLIAVAVREQAQAQPPSLPSPAPFVRLESQQVSLLPQYGRQYTLNDVARWVNDQTALLSQYHPNLTPDQWIDAGSYRVFLPR